MPEHTTQGSAVSKKTSKWLKIFWVSIEFISVQVADACMERLAVISKEIDLFLGAFFTLLGVLNWSSSKYCDGNTADYLSCTNPVTYYFYDWLAVTCVVLGVVLMLVWFVKNRKPTK